MRYMFRKKSCRDPMVFSRKTPWLICSHFPFMFEMAPSPKILNNESPTWISSLQASTTNHKELLIWSCERSFGPCNHHQRCGLAGGPFLGWENPKSPEFAAPKKTTKKQDRRNMGSNRMKHGIQQMKKQFLGPMLVFTKSILDCPFLRGFPSLSNRPFSTMCCFSFGVVWLEPTRGWN